MRFWTKRGADGFRLDALERIAKDPELRDDPPAQEPSRCRCPRSYADLNTSTRATRRESRRCSPRSARLPAVRSSSARSTCLGQARPYLGYLDAAFAFELMFSRWRPEAVASDARPREARSRVDALEPRLLPPADAAGEDDVRLAATLQLTLPGTGVRLPGRRDRPPGRGRRRPAVRRARARPARHPMQWEPGPLGGFTTGDPWLAPVDPESTQCRRPAARPGFDPLALQASSSPCAARAAWLRPAGAAEACRVPARRPRRHAQLWRPRARGPGPRQRCLLRTPEADDHVLPAHGGR